ncbi:hypothetical protein Moror_13187 [Moniliophthora roreri MCA 2997]|uniref:Uncharacterized protein n=1 Tax=Moniliophthora roreri (strain MCA 2997) TaxID=1381753 RepID=V2X900_MONRO|nr:hypothetical protein Moror_13187 [Moniliophthora roreri MCA 2997]
MYSNDNSSLASVNSDELTWLDAYTQIIQDPSLLDYSAPNSPETDIPSNLLPYPSPTSDSSPTGLRAISTRRHHYQRSTKSSSAKAVAPPSNNSKRLSKSLAAKRPNHPNLRPMASPPPFSAPSLSNSTSSLTSTRSDHSTSVPSTPRPGAKRCHSPTSAPPSPRSPEWIYRRPKSPTTPPRKRPDLNRSASQSSATSISYFSEVSSGSPLLGSEFSSSSTSQDVPTLWTPILRPRKRSGSVKSVASSLNKSTDLPSLWFGADEANANSSFSGSRSKKAATASPVIRARHLPKSPSQVSFSSSSAAGGRIQRNRSSSVSSSISSASTATTSSVSQPSTPTSPSLSPMIAKKFKPNPNHTCIVEIDEPESEVELEKLMGFPGLKRTVDVDVDNGSSSPVSAVTPLARSDSLLKLKVDTRSCTTSSNKSVKFVETPIVHYASAGYEPDFWHVPGEDSGMDSRINVDGMDTGDEAEKENFGQRGKQPSASALSIPHPYAYAKGIQMDIDEEEEARDVVKQRIPTPDYRPEDRDMMCITPTPERLQERGGRSPRRLVNQSVKRKPSSSSSWRSARSPSPSRSVTPRPTISGPFVLGSLPTHPVAPPPPPPPPPPKSASHHPYGRGHGIALRSAPSLESFKSAKSSGAKSVRSLRSLRSLKSIPESVKSGISVGAREMKEWFKGRVVINAL